ncbi:hypothetical protein [Actinacidiphila alni]|uniref:hypothetical protein n=1 Tax=Actinacidiphila alni TaxID=380248 RepID=UPI003456B4D1
MPRIVPVMAQKAPGDLITGALWNANVKALGDFLTGTPAFWGYQSSAQAVANATFASITFDTEIIDTEGGHSTASNTSRYVCQVAGTYSVQASVCWATNTTGFRASRITKNGTTVPTSEQITAPVTGFATTAFTATDVALAVGDYIELGGYQSSGGSLSTTSNGGFDYTSYLRARWESN